MSIKAPKFLVDTAEELVDLFHHPLERAPIAGGILVSNVLFVMWWTSSPLNIGIILNSLIGLFILYLASRTLLWAISSRS